jgi:4-hydroxy-tetrahydrodipicolinate synthase
MFGGINASVPTCFDAGKGIDLDLMAAHCLWLFSTGCHGLLVLDKTGEVASLTTNERIAVLQGLAARGVPASKLIAGIGPASPVDSARIAACANELGIRGVLVTAIASGKIMPQDVIPDALRTIILSCPASLHVYVSFNVSHHAIPTCLTAVEAFNAETGGRLTGIRDETSGSKFGLAAIDRFCGARCEVYGSDETVLGDLIAAGGSGLMSGGANLLGRHCRQVLDAPQPHIAAILARTIEAVSRMLRSSPMVPSLKTLLVRHTGQANWGRMRLPLRSLTPAEREAVFRLVDSSGLKLRPAEPVR